MTVTAFVFDERESEQVEDWRAALEGLADDQLLWLALRDVTERPETPECGSNFLSGGVAGDITSAVAFVTTHQTRWKPPPEYLVDHVAETVCRIVAGYRIADPAELSWRRRHATSG